MLVKLTPGDLAIPVPIWRHLCEERCFVPAWREQLRRGATWRSRPPSTSGGRTGRTSGVPRTSWRPTARPLSTRPSEAREVGLYLEAEIIKVQLIMNLPGYEPISNIYVVKPQLTTTFEWQPTFLCPIFIINNRKILLNNDHLSTTATILGSQLWSL